MKIASLSLLMLLSFMCSNAQFTPYSNDDNTVLLMHYYFTDYDEFIAKLTTLTESADKAQELDAFWDELIATGNFPFAIGDRVAFLYRGEANTVSWAGDFNGWDMNADPGTRLGISNIWLLEKEFPSDARSGYKIVVNGSEWITDEHNPYPLSVEFSNSDLRMPDYEIPYETIPRSSIPKGELSDNILKTSTNLGYTSQYRVYTPAGYPELSDLPVIYVTDGPGFSHDSLGKMKIILDNLIYDESMEPVIAVFLDPRDPDNLSFNRRSNEYRNNINFVNYVTKELIPDIDAAYKTEANPGSRAIAGYSYGGYNAAYFCAMAYEYIQNTAILSPIMHPNPPDGGYNIHDDMMAADLADTKIYMSYGIFDTREIGDFTRLKNIFGQKNKEFEYDIVSEGHTMSNWSGVIGNALKYFFPDSGNEILSFQLNQKTGIIKNNEIIIPMPVDTDLSSFAAEFEIPEGTELLVNGIVQQSGVTVNDFSVPLTYTLKNAEDILAVYEVYIQHFVPELYDEVAPLVKDNWSSHTWPYNAYYPETNDPDHRHGVVNGRVASSCGPTAVSRLIHYWEYPKTGSGSASFTDRYGCNYSANFGATTYRWNEMPDELHPDDDESVYGPVAELVYHVGTSALDERVTGYFDLTYSLPEFFLYADSIEKLYREDFTKEEWITIFKHELSNGRVVLASGGTPEGGGHWFLCDGYNSDDEFHFIMGWGGQGDGYYDIDNPNGYSEGGDIVIGVMPQGHEFVPNFNTEVDETESNLVTFKNTTWQLTNVDLSWYWDFGDGNSSSERNPNHEYSDSDIYTVTLTVSSRERAKTISKEVSTLSRPVATILRLPEGETINIDGEIDRIWHEVEANLIDQPFVNESPSFNAVPIWKAVWNDKSIYVLVETDDDEWAPSWVTGAADWLSDKPELYIDVNSNLADGIGAGSNSLGHYQIAPAYSRMASGSKETGMMWSDDPYDYSNSYDEQGYSVFEYKIPLTSLIDSERSALNPQSRSAE
ncbi:MAG: C10 family peptidase [Prolixibacteraceae bacterium]|nr:C10 family peptidase [Prolixibacteraceae bacterium]